MLDWFSPQTIETLHDKKVTKFQGHLAVYVGGVQQSGPWVKKIWSKTNFSGTTILILGSGCGILHTLVQAKNPHAVVTGIELDPDMTYLGKKYFHLDPSTIVTGDAFDFITTTKSKFDLILVDLYQGSTFPEKFESAQFLEQLSQTMSKTGTVIFNRLATKTTNFERGKFVDKLEKYFTIQEINQIDFNILVSCSRREA